jgi:hypothetical protein
VAWSAAQALSTLAAPEAIGALEAYGRRLSAQEGATVARIVAGLRSEDKEDGSALQKQVDDLRDKLRTLEDQLQTATARLDALSGVSESAAPPA